MPRPACSALALLALAVCGCSRLPERALIPVPPARLDGGWQRVTLDTPAAAEAPAVPRLLKPAQRVRASYRKEGVTVGVDAYAMPSQASAFEAQQRWRNEAGSLAFQNGNLFVICASEGAGQPGLIAFSKLLEEAWLGGRR
jgi:hypothetical protein